MTSAQGEDRSNFQAVGPWKNLDFGWAKATEGLTFNDRTFPANWAALKHQVAYRGAFHFFHPGLDPHRQAVHFMQAVTAQGLHPGDSLAIDTEIAAGEDGSQMAAPHAHRRSEYFRADDSGRARLNPHVIYPRRRAKFWLPPKITEGTVSSASLEFLSLVKSIARSAVGGDYCPIYCYTYFAFLPQVAACNDYLLWLAYYSSHAPPSTGAWHTWTQWQFAGGGGQLGADQDAFNGNRATMDAFMRAYKPGSRPHPAPQPAPDWTENIVNQLPTMGSGDSGADVRTAQGCLCARGHAVTIDGTFGPATHAAVLSFQAAKGLAQDGIIGPKTWAALLNR